MRKLLMELFGYGAVSGVALALDVATLEMLVKVGGWHYVPAAVTAFFAGGVLAYHLSVKYVFTARQLANRSLELGYFVALGVIGVIVNVAVLSLAIGQMGLDLLPAKLLAACGTFTTNFVLRRQLLFAPARIAE
jgi:putative flippase GtrA